MSYHKYRGDGGGGGGESVTVISANDQIYPQLYDPAIGLLQINAGSTLSPTADNYVMLGTAVNSRVLLPASASSQDKQMTFIVSDNNTTTPAAYVAIQPNGSDTIQLPDQENGVFLGGTYPVYLYGGDAVTYKCIGTQWVIQNRVLGSRMQLFTNINVTMNIDQLCVFMNPSGSNRTYTLGTGSFTTYYKNKVFFIAHVGTVNTVAVGALTTLTAGQSCRIRVNGSNDGWELVT